jgi:putative transposase
MLSVSNHVFSEILPHVNWHCKGDYPHLVGDMESKTHRHIENYCMKTKGVSFLGIGGTETHVHLVIQIEPNICASEWIGKAKGACSHDMNADAKRQVLQWQRGFGAVSFARRDLPAILRYVAKQKEHHAKGTVNAVLENYGEADPGETNDEGEVDKAEAGE